MSAAPAEPNYDFSPIVGEFFHGNFSRITSSLVKEILFRVYFDAQSNKQKKSDFDIARELGVSRAQAKNLLYKYDLRYASDPELMELVLGSPTVCSKNGEWVSIRVQRQYHHDWLLNYLSHENGLYARDLGSGENIKMKAKAYIGVVRDACQGNQNLSNAIEAYLEQFCKDNPDFRKLLQGNNKIGKLKELLASEDLRNTLLNTQLLGGCIEKIVEIVKDLIVF